MPTRPILPSSVSILKITDYCSFGMKLDRRFVIGISGEMLKERFTSFIQTINLRFHGFRGR
jgi:hypothetical protein